MNFSSVCVSIYHSIHVWNEENLLESLKKRNAHFYLICMPLSAIRLQEKIKLILNYFLL